MKTFYLVTLAGILLLFSRLGLARENNWVRIGSNSDYTLYLDEGSAHVDGGTTAAYFLLDYKRPQGSGSFIYLSDTRHMRFDCAGSTFRPDGAGGFWSRNMGVGESRMGGRPQEGMRPIKDPSSLAASMMKVACARAKQPSDQIASATPVANKGNSQVGAAESNKAPALAETPAKGGNNAAQAPETGPRHSISASPGQAPDLLGFRIGALASNEVPVLAQLSSRGYTTTKIMQVHEESGTKFGAIAYKGLTGKGVPGDYLVMLYDEGSTVKILVRGESLASPSFVPDFLKAIRSKLGTPPWAEQELTSNGNSEWAFTSRGATRFGECFSKEYYLNLPKGFIQQQGVGDRYIDVGWPSVAVGQVASLKPSNCQFAIRLRLQTTLPGAGPLRTTNELGRAVAGYQITVIDLLQLSAAAQTQESDSQNKLEAQKKALQKAATAPKF